MMSDKIIETARRLISEAYTFLSFSKEQCKEILEKRIEDAEEYETELGKFKAVPIKNDCMLVSLNEDKIILDFHGINLLVAEWNEKDNNIPINENSLIICSNHKEKVIKELYDKYEQRRIDEDTDNGTVSLNDKLDIMVYKNALVKEKNNETKVLLLDILSKFYDCNLTYKPTDEVSDIKSRIIFEINKLKGKENNEKDIDNIIDELD